MVDWLRKFFVKLTPEPKVSRSLNDIVNNEVRKAQGMFDALRAADLNFTSDEITVNWEIARILSEENKTLQDVLTNTSAIAHAWKAAYMKKRVNGFVQGRLAVQAKPLTQDYLQNRISLENDEGLRQRYTQTLEPELPHMIWNVHPDVDELVADLSTVTESAVKTGDTRPFKTFLCTLQLPEDHIEAMMGWIALSPLELYRRETQATAKQKAELKANAGDVDKSGEGTAQRDREAEHVDKEVTNHPSEYVQDPKVFISYSWDDNKTWVRFLAERLVKKGVDVRLDQWQIEAGHSFTEFMEKEVIACDYVIVVCTPTYARKSNERSGGVGYEQQIVSGQLMAGVPRAKFIPIVRSGKLEPGPGNPIPTHFGGTAYIDFRDDTVFEKSFEELLRKIYNRPRFAPPNRGPRPSLPTNRRTRRPKKDR